MSKKPTSPKAKCAGAPECGDMFVCDCCDMRILVVRDCCCEPDDEDCKPCFKCCGQEMCQV